MDEATESILTLFVGVMVGVQLAQSGVTKVSAMIAAQVVKKLPQQALTHGMIYPIVKRVAAYLGVSMTKRLFASGVAKAIPILGAALSGSLTLATFYPMSKRLQRHLASLELTKPGHRGDVVENPDDIGTLIAVEKVAVPSEPTDLVVELDEARSDNKGKRAEMDGSRVANDEP